jgi:hypothetical protein
MRKEMGNSADGETRGGRGYTPPIGLKSARTAAAVIDEGMLLTTRDADGRMLVLVRSDVTSTALQ